MDVFVVHHVHTFDDGREEVQLIGVYSTAELARQAVERLSGRPGFHETQNGFHVDTSRLDRDNWTEGYKLI